MFPFFLILTRALENVICLGVSRLSQVNNSPRENVFPAGVANFGKTVYRFPERSTQDNRDGFFLYSTQASFPWPRVDLARLLRRAYSRPFWITSFEFVKVCGIRFSIWESFIGFYICCYPITTILACLFFCWSSNFVEKVVLNESMGAKTASLVSFLVYYDYIWSEFQIKSLV